MKISFQEMLKTPQAQGPGTSHRLHQQSEDPGKEKNADSYKV